MLNAIWCAACALAPMVPMIIPEMAKAPASMPICKLLGNIFIDALVGAIPVLGWVFDFVFKADKKNVQLLEEHYVLGKHTGSAKPYILAIVLILFFTIAILLILSIWFLKAIADLFNMRLI